jgi:uncharacterized protein DUF4920
MKSLILVAVVCAAAVVPAGETKLGAGVTLETATAIASLTTTPAQFVGKTIRVDGIATEVCEEMGCWMAIAADGDGSGATVRLKVKDGVIVFPVTAKGKKVSAQGVFESVDATDVEGAEAAGEHAKKDPKASARYQIKATGAIIR